MGVLDKIPNHLLPRWNQANFTMWVAFAPIAWQQKKELMVAWSELNNMKFTQDDFIRYASETPKHDWHNPR